MPSSPPLNQNGNDVDDTVEELENLIGAAYNNVSLTTAGELQFRFPNDGGTVQKSITLPTGSGTATIPEVLSSVTESNNVYTFGTSYGNNIGTTIDIGGITTNSTSISSLSSTVGGHTTDISNIRSRVGSNNLNNAISALENNTGSSHLKGLVDGHTADIDDMESREQFKGIIQHPDVTDAQIGALTHQNHPLIVNGRTYNFSQSSNNHALANSVLGAFRPSNSWESEDNHVNRAYNTLVSGSYYDYTGTNTVSGNNGEWIKIQLPEAVVLSSFTMSADSTQSLPRSFKVLGSVDGTNYDLLGEYTDVTVSTTDAGTNFKLDSSLSAYGSAYDYYAIVVTRVSRIGTKQNVAIRHLRFFSVSKDVSDTIAQTATLNTTVSGHTTDINALQTATPSVDAIVINIDIDGSTPPHYTIHGISLMPLELLYGHKYIFNYPSLHPLKFSTTEDGTHNGGSEFTDGRTDTITTPAAAAGVYWQFEFTNIGQRYFYYYCSSHSGMGKRVFGGNGQYNIKRDGFTYDTSVSPPKIIIERENELTSHTQELDLSDSYTSAAVLGSDLTLNRISGTNATTITLPSGGGATSTTNYPEVAMTSNSLPSPLVAAASTSYNLFTEKLFADDNLGNIGEYELNSVSYPIQVWGYDASDENVIIMAHEAVAPYHPQTQFVKITKSGNLVTGLGGNVNNTGKYTSGHINYTTLASLIAGYNAATHMSGNRTFAPHALFDLAVNNSPAFHAFDEDAATQWVSHSNTYDVITGNALQTGFSGTPPTNIYMNPGSGYWATINLYYTKVTSDETNTFVRYELNVGATYGIEFSMNGSNELEFEVNDATHGTDNPGSFKINGGAAQTAPHVVAANDTIELFNTAANGGGSVGDFTVPSELAINVEESKLASTTDVGEYLKIDLGSAMEAETLTLKSVAEYKEPRINMTSSNQCGYEVTASSSDPGSPVYELFNSLTTPSTDYWVSDIGKYHISTGNYSASANLGTDFPSGGTTVDGEYVAITLQDKRKLLGYKLTKPDASTDDNSPKAFKLYARENSTSAWVLLTSESLTTAVGEYVSGDVNTGGTRFPSTGDLTPTTAYQTYALVFETIFTSGTSYSVWLSEFQLFCQPAEIENFKLYGSTDDATWTPIHDQSTSANITSSGTDFTITNPSSYQYYGLVVTKNGGYHNVSLGEMKLGVPQTVNLSEYYKLADWKTLIAGCADFAAFKTAVAAL